MQILKALSALLTYPTRGLVEAVPAIRAIVAQDGLVRADLEPLLMRLETTDLYELEEAYVLLFDRSRSLSLNIFEHVHGESRDRGQAMVELKRLYEEGGLALDTTELPDFIPLFLEYCSLQPEVEARALLAEPAHVFTALAERLRRRESVYAAVFEALVALAATKPEAAAFEALVEVDDAAPDDLAALDRVWEEEEIRFGAGAATADCGVDALAAKLRQAKRPAPGLEPQTNARPRTVFTHSASAQEA
ncbi:nitrate reductase molybdenum cofactor assembly chaperone [Salinarimonas sp.]|uniref:nitrate reductase molybdenum cofactor assembly chaperone n=1 Tax=Salinarimonas sp. TaxID=2766526 RepID=UPI00391BF1C5